MVKDREGTGSQPISVDVRVIKSNDVVGNEFVLIVELANNTAKIFVIDSMEMILPAELSDFYEKPSFRPTELRDSARKVLIMPFPSKDLDMMGLERTAFLPGNYEFIFIVRYSDYKVGGERGPKNPRVVSHSQFVTFKPPLSSILLGGILGALLLSLFLLIFHIKETRDSTFEWGKMSLKLLEAVITFIFASIVSVIAILIIQRLGDFKLPISVKVEDYLGGVIIGMFSLKVGDSLYKFFVKEVK